jgi:alpha-glucosidase (family GH31 glycosyl hydrolase)
MKNYALENKRRFVIIVDPHVASRPYKNPLYTSGNRAEAQIAYPSIATFKDQPFIPSNFTSIWIKKFDGKPFVGKCWPGDVHYVDFLNSNAR